LLSDLYRRIDFVTAADSESAAFHKVKTGRVKYGFRNGHNKDGAAIITENPKKLETHFVARFHFATVSSIVFLSQSLK
jgi:hypothetical protein